MNNDVNILSLDPMYSCLHDQISKQYTGKKFALLSSFAMKVYLREFDLFSISKLISMSDFSDCDIELVMNTNSHYRARLSYNENRDLDLDEIYYMAKFSAVFSAFIKSNNIGLVLIHNDLRWHHAIAIEICKRQNISYLVTEQGLFRPYTTVVDNRGINAYSSVMDLEIFEVPLSESKKRINYKNTHNSFMSKMYFFVFLLLFKLESILGEPLKFQHNDFSLAKYGRRFFKQLFNGAYDNNVKLDSTNFSDYVFVPLQLEDDTQILIHSSIKSNQKLIELIEYHISKIDGNRNIFFKKHPNDTRDYKLGDNSYFVSGSIRKLAENSSLAITINSSAAIDIIKTDTPLLLLGESIYNKKNVALKVDKESFGAVVRCVLINNDKYHTRHARDEYINYLFEFYSLHGAGFMYDDDEIKRILVNNHAIN
ncbi:hypothetical protein BCT90_22155 [Vibrio lentus]|uniref:capsular polysaccharide export protein, LipB/KpsS family n=1 Tax=Vibrio lentus TaxID=136468 RepID=UPI000C8267A1|nr:hypothetical protein [Vibrio lentus]PMK98505.1 hypothetical protein BCT90_22155 [Vibrio lentus]